MQLTGITSLRRATAALAGLLGATALSLPAIAAKPLVHDGEYYFVEAQYKDKWAKENKEIDAKLADIRKANGGKRPNILYVLIDDVMSSGGTELEALEKLSDFPCAAVVVGVDREHAEQGRTAAQAFTEKTGVPVYSMIGLGELCRRLEGKIEAASFEAMREFCRA